MTAHGNLQALLINFCPRLLGHLPGSSQPWGATCSWTTNLQLEIQRQTLNKNSTCKLAFSIIWEKVVKLHDGCGGVCPRQMRPHVHPLQGRPLQIIPCPCYNIAEIVIVRSDNWREIWKNCQIFLRHTLLHLQIGTISGCHQPTRHASVGCMQSM